MSRIKFNNVDLAWLRMDQEKNPMLITVVIQFNEQLNYDSLLLIIKDLFTRYRRFRQRVVKPEGFFSRPYWEDDPDLRIEDHLERVQIQLPVDDSSLEELINQNMNLALDFTHPLWKLTLVDNHPDGSVLILRIHHVIADGISLMRVLLRMTTTAPGNPAPNAVVVNKNPAEQDNNNAYSEVQNVPISSPADSQARHGTVPLVRKPNALDMLAAIWRILVRWPDPHTVFKGQLGMVKKAVWTEPISTIELRKIAKSKQATVNDVLMAIAAGAIRKYFILRGDNRKLKLRAFILVNMRGHAIDDDLGNQFGLVFLPLPVDRDQPEDRLEATKQGMDFLKASAEYAATDLILNILGMLPAWVEPLAVSFLDTKGTVVATNVPGPRRVLYMAGAPISSIKAWVPQSGRIGIGFSFISYNNQMTVGLNADVGLVPDPEKIIQAFMEEYQSMLGSLSEHPQK